MEPARVIIICLSLAAVSLADIKIGKVVNCPGSKAYKNGLDVHITWSPRVLKPQTEYTINGSVIVNTDVFEVTAGATVWLPGDKDPFYKVPVQDVTCKDGDIFDVLQMFNVSCPIKKGTHKQVVNLKKSIGGSEAAITGTFIVEGYLKDKKGHEIACLRSEITISN